MDAKTLLIAALIVIAAAFLAFWYANVQRRRAQLRTAESAGRAPLRAGIGFVANFLDTLGIGSYATTTSMLKMWKVIPDEKIPGTLNVGYALPTVVQGVIFMTIVEVEFATLVAIIAAAVIGAYLGAGVVSELPRRKIQIGMGTALLCAAALMVFSLLGIGPEPGVALGLSGTKLAIAVGCSVVLGALMMLGIGFYAPCMIMISLLGMDPKVSYPIMMGACAFLIPAGSTQFVRKETYDLRTALAFTIAGSVAVLLAAPLVDQIPLLYLRLLVLVVVLYTAIRMLQSAFVERGPVAKPGMAQA
jgi:uncharacterized membrane protein YfcA